VRKKALPAAAAVEVYHTWTLVHDDIIDNDSKRRGFPTVHEEIRLETLKWGYSEPEAAEMGRNIAILAGDLQHAWPVRLLLDLIQTGVSLPVIYELIWRLEVDVTSGLLEGEAQDVLFAKRRIEELSEAEVMGMLEQKTGLLYQYAALAGASIGLDQTPSQNKFIEGLKILIEYQGIEHTRKLAETIVEQALTEIAILPDSYYKELLLTWAKYVANRDF
jgi:geranylgeranyl diphosphate synthase type I